MPAEELRTVQAHRLSWQVQRCWDGAPFYRERLAAAAVEPDDVRDLADLARLPLLTAAELVAEQRAHPPHGRLSPAPPSSWCGASASGPSHGDPADPLWTEADVVHRTSLAARALWSCGARPGNRLLNLLPSRSTASAAVADGGRKLGLVALDPHASGEPEPVSVQAPQGRLVVVTDDSSEPRAEPPGVDPDHDVIAAIWGGARSESRGDRLEHATEPDARAAVGRARPFLVYGSGHLGPTAAAECAARAGLHWAEDHFLVEVLDPATLLAAREGDVGALVITHLTREATPLLRFRTGHRARVVRDPCACGRTQARSPAVVDARRVRPR